MWFVCHARWRRKLSSKKSAVNCHRKRTKTQPTVHICKLNSALAIIKFFYSNSSKSFRFFGCGPKLRNVCMCECGMRMWKFSNMSSLPVGVCVCVWCVWNKEGGSKSNSNNNTCLCRRAVLPCRPIDRPSNCHMRQYCFGTHRHTHPHTHAGRHTTHAYKNTHTHTCSRTMLSLFDIRFFLQFVVERGGGEVEKKKEL